MEGTAPPFLGTVKGDLGHSTSQALLLGHNNKKGSQSAIAVYASSLFMLHFYSELSEKFDFTYRVALHSNCNAHTYVTYVCLFVFQSFTRKILVTTAEFMLEVVSSATAQKLSRWPAVAGFSVLLVCLGFVGFLH